MSAEVLETEQPLLADSRALVSGSSEAGPPETGVGTFIKLFLILLSDSQMPRCHWHPSIAGCL